jgi:phage-related protein (TIGR01555 family)
MFDWLKKPVPVEAPKPKHTRAYDAFDGYLPRLSMDDVVAMNVRRNASEDMIKGVATDGMPGFGLGYTAGAQNTVPDSLLSWYSVQTFIGNQLSSILAQHWLIYKCCNMPARDAIRNGYEVTVNNGEEIKPKILDAIRQADKRYRVKKNLEEFITMGRVFGIRIMMFKVDSPDKNYYSNPFNPDGITPGSYKGMVQIDPYWITPELDMEAASNPMSEYFYEPTWWIVNGKRIHRTHLVIFRNGFLADILQPTYLYGGVSVPQKIYERVYCAERTANEAPQLALTKRMIVQHVDLAQAVQNPQQFNQRAQVASQYLNNYATKFVGIDEEVEHFETSLADLDAVIITQYQLVAAIANVPSTKLLGTTPKGFNSTGEHEEASYHEELESLQSSDLAEVLERHHLLLVRSEIAPKFKIKPFETSVRWETLDSVNAVEMATINKLKAEAGQVLLVSGAIDGIDERKRIINDPESGYNGILDEEVEDIEGSGDPLATNTKGKLEKNVQYDPEGPTEP